MKKMERKKDIGTFIEWFRNHEAFRENIVHWETIPEREAQYAPFPETLHPKLKKILEKRGIKRLYTHQKTAFEYAAAGTDVTIVTPTASGKSLCYHLPVLQKILSDPNARALYIFPTKALSNDQKSELNEWLDEGELPVHCHTYDGDTSPTVRQKIRKAGHIVITNPDMLHTGILPHHTKWISLFENLQYVVIDELHIYRGVFGSHTANVIRRLRRLCRFYGSDPTFICTSATIANPKELAEKLTEKPMKLIEENGAPASRKHFVFYNPPVVNKMMNIRKSLIAESTRIAGELLKNGFQTVIFARSRVMVELILTRLRKMMGDGAMGQRISGYRGGYLPSERRRIEKGLRSGDIIGVVSTNALELGVDIGQLKASVLTGFPGTIASAWQQAGRAGRRDGEAFILFVAGSSPLDQYIVRHPEYFFGKSPETARINPDNLIILADHIKCAAYELPFRKGEAFGGAEVEDLLDYLAEKKVLYPNGDKFYWMGDSFPAHNISLRSATQENVVIIERMEGNRTRVIGEMDTFSALTLLHEEAIYFHQGNQYQVEELDWPEKKAYVREVQVNYYTDAHLAVQLKVLESDRERKIPNASVFFGDVSVQAMATVFKKIKLETGENIGSGPIHLPEQILHTQSAWFSLDEPLTSRFENEHMEEALEGISHALRHIVSVFIMCDPQDVHVVPQVKSTFNGKPTVFFYDHYPGGVGLSEQIYDQLEEIIEAAKSLVEGCPCENGCPSCIGAGFQSPKGKRDCLRLFSGLLGAGSGTGKEGTER